MATQNPSPAGLSGKTLVNVMDALLRQLNSDAERLAELSQLAADNPSDTNIADALGTARMGGERDRRRAERGVSRVEA